MRLVFVGPPGAGKGTQAELLFERHGIKTLASGNILREAIRNGEPIGREAARCMEMGVLVPDQLITDLILSRLEKIGSTEPFILDGFPRTEIQAKALDAWLVQKKQPPIQLVVDFEIDTDKIIKRLAGRRICKGCGANYHLENLKPKKPGICDRCGQELQTRPDDHLSTIGNRLAVYHQETEPLLNFYRAQGKLRAVPGEFDIEDQYEALASLLQAERLL